jgi:ATP-binding cassette subfamily B multidrug efflux pump
MSQAAIPPQADEVITKSFDMQVTQGLTHFIKPYTWQLLASLLFMGVASIAGVAGPYFVKMALDGGLAVGSLPTLRLAVLLYLGVTLLQWLTNFMRIATMARIGQSIILDIRTKLFAHLQELSMTFYNHYSVGRVISRVINDVNVLQDFITWALLAIARDLFTLVGILAFMLSMNLHLSLLTITVMPVMAYVTFKFRALSRQYYRQTRTAISWVNSVLAENINAVRVVQSFAREEFNYNNFSGVVNQNNLTVNLKAARLASIFFPSIDFLGNIALALVIWLGGAAVLGETITPGVLVAFVLYIGRFFEPIRDLSMRYDALMSTMASGERILDLLSAPVEVKDKPGAPDLPIIRGGITFKDVHFHYPDDPTPVLEDIYLDIQAGETVAFVGKTGAGKTTMIKLLARFHDPTTGQVLVDGYDLSQVTQNSLRRQMGIVLQDPFLFSGTVMENIRFGRLEASQEDVVAAAQAVGAHEFILRLSQGYDTPVQEGGVILSVGQRQLISFARALLADPRILILDEATSSVDTQTERIIQQALARLLKGRTSFVIAHRLSTIVNADRIVVIQDGRIVEEGQHHDLLTRHGIYYNLYSMRFEEPES